MKVPICKAALTGAVICLSLGGASIAQAGTCSNASLKGKYGQTISGQLLPAPGVVIPQNGVAMSDFDGNGNFTQTDFVVIGGTPTNSAFQSEIGRYQINADCTGTASFHYTDGTVIDLALVVVSEGRGFRTVVTSLLLYGTAVPANIGSSGTRVINAD
jgi:hypothetical protein